MESIDNEENTLTHISHLHPLKLLKSPEPRPICHACNMACADQSYSCTDCQYFLHVTCATIRRCMDHSSHPAHSLALGLNRPYCADFKCDACGEDANYTFLLSCRECDYYLHLHCAALPHITVNHHSHCHPLFLVHENPYPPNMSYTCDLCKRYLNVNKWFYLCRSCNFGGHVGCFPPETLEVVSPGLQAPTAPAPRPQQAKPNGDIQMQMYTSMMLANSMSTAIRGMKI